MNAQATAREQAAASRPAPIPEAAMPVASRLMAAALGTVDLLVIALGERLGYYRLLAACPTA